MPSGVVQYLEIIKIDEQECGAGLVARAGCDCLMEAVKQQAAVGQLAQRVIKGKIVDFLFRLFAFGDVEKSADIIRDFFFFANHGCNGQPFRIDFPVLAAVPDLALPEIVAMQHFAHTREKPGVVPIRLEHAQVFADRLFGTVATQIRENTVDTNDHLILIGYDHAFLDLESNRCNTQSCLALFQNPPSCY